MWFCRSSSLVIKAWLKLAARHLMGLKRCGHEKALTGRAFCFVAALDWRSVHLFLAEEASLLFVISHHPIQQYFPLIINNLDPIKRITLSQVIPYNRTI